MLGNWDRSEVFIVSHLRIPRPSGPSISSNQRKHDHNGRLAVQSFKQNRKTTGNRQGVYPRIYDAEKCSSDFSNSSATLVENSSLMQPTFFPLRPCYHKTRI